MSGTASTPPRPTFTAPQLEQYLHTLSLPSSLLDPAGAITPTYENLKTLQQHHLAIYPFENLSLHYSQSHTISLDAESLFEKFVERGRGRGGYCMENNAFFGTVLRGLGFGVTSVGGRVCDGVGGGDGAGFGGWLV
ncbi:MAG: hypothetical protein Q9169_006960 [Polycauliona sp. 2 TL-2023]